VVVPPVLTVMERLAVSVVLVRRVKYSVGLWLCRQASDQRVMVQLQLADSAQRAMALLLPGASGQRGSQLVLVGVGSGCRMGRHWESLFVEADFEYRREKEKAFRTLPDRMRGLAVLQRSQRDLAWAATMVGQIRMAGLVGALAGQTVRVRSAVVAADRKAMADLVLLGRRPTQHPVEMVVQTLMRQMPAFQMRGSVLKHWLDRILV
jgi:hypothetical protein